MKPLKDFIIPFVGLKDGLHEFDFEIKDAFFGEFEYSIIKKGNLLVKMELEKRDNMLVLLFHISGTVELICERCLEPYNQEIASTEKQIIKMGNILEKGTEEDVVYIGHEVYEIFVAPFIYDFIHLALPIVSKHPENEADQSDCNPEVIALLNKLQGNTEAGSTDADPRWEALKKFKDN